MSTKYVVKLTMEDCKKLGIVVCAHCGYPPNNHFDFGKRVCAHAPCPGYKVSFRYGKDIRK